MSTTSQAVLIGLLPAPDLVI